MTDELDKQIQLMLPEPKYLPYYNARTQKYYTMMQRIKRNKKRFGFTVIRHDEILGLFKTCSDCKISKNRARDFTNIFRKDRKYFQTSSKCNKCSYKHVLKNNSGKPRNLKYKLKAYKKIQDKIECVRCGCDDVRFLEINHKNGLGRQELLTRRKFNISGTNMYSAINMDL